MLKHLWMKLKEALVSVVQEDKISEILARYEDKYFKTKNGRGIAFSTPVDDTIGVETKISLK